MGLSDSLDNVKIINEDSRRIIQSLYEPDSGLMKNITRGEINLLTIHDPQQVLGNHWHEFNEYFIFLGNGKFVVENIKTRDRKTYDFVRGNRIYVPAGIAHALRTEKGTDIISIVEEPFDPARTHTYKVMD